MTRRLLRLDLRQSGRHIGLGLAALALANLGFYVVAVQPTSREYRRLTEEPGPSKGLSDSRERVEERESFLEAVRQAEADLAGLRGEILATRAQRLVQVQQELARICREFDIDLDAVAFNHELLLDEGLDRLAMSVPLAGNYTNLRKFIQAVEDSDEFLVIERISLARGKEGGQLLSLNVILSTYFVAPEELVARKKALARRRG